MKKICMSTGTRQIKLWTKNCRSPIYALGILFFGFVTVVTVFNSGIFQQILIFERKLLSCFQLQRSRGSFGGGKYLITWHLELCII